LIISASRRTDIPAFYSEWFMNRIRAGYCTVPNPFNRSQVSVVSLRPEDVDVVVFWTRNPRPLFPHLAELDGRGYVYYFQYTVMNNPRVLDRKTPSLGASLRAFRELSERIGAERLIWRYDPIVFSNVTGVDFHQREYERIAQELRGCTKRCVISIVDSTYRKTSKRLRELTRQGVELVSCNDGSADWFAELMRTMAGVAHENEMEIYSCAEAIDLRPYGIRPGKCIDDEYIREVFGLSVASRKDPGQRELCNCVVSKDIGMYDTCLFECQYCYATRSFERAKANYEGHDPNSPSLVGWYDVMSESRRYRQRTLWDEGQNDVGS
jgi:hypothetical protein